MGWIQVVDDYDDARETLLLLLRACGFDAEASSSAHEALARISERGAPSVIITDLRMDEVDGVSFARAVRRALPGAPLRIIAFTGVPSFVDAEGLFDRVVTKPGEPKEIVSLVREALATD